MRARLHHLLPALVVSVLAAAPASAATFGADLSQPVTSTSTCGNAFPFAQNATSCMGYSVAPTSYAPMSGIVNTVRVKTGDFDQGPMQVVVLRSYYQNNLQDPGHPNFFCCFLQEYGPTFTPARNAITSVPSTLGMVEDPTPPASDGNTVAKGDFLGLSVLAQNVPFPLSLDSSGYAAFYAPAPQSPNNPPAPSPNALSGSQGAVSGYVLMMNADIEPIDSGGAGGGTGAGGNTGGGGANGGAGGTGGGTDQGAGGGTQRPVAIQPAGGRFGSSAASLPLVCQLTTACTGTLALQSGPAAGAARAAAKPKVYGSAHFSIPAGTKRAIKVKLNAAGRKFAKHKKKLTLYARAVVSGKSFALKVTLKAS